MSNYSRRGERGSASSSRLHSSVSTRYRNSRDVQHDRQERSQPVKGILSGVEAPKSYGGRSSPLSKENSVHRRPDSDSKIATHARLLSRADTLEDFSQACRQIESLLEIPDNRKYIIRCFNYLEHQFLDGFKWIHGATWKDSGINIYGRLLGVIFNSMGNHSNSVITWLIDSIFNSSTARKYSLAFLIRDVILTAIFEMKPEQISFLVGSIHEHIDNISEPPLFKIFSSIFSTGILKNQRNTKSATFQDFSDLVIGWMTDEHEGELNDSFYHCYALVQNLKPFFLKEVEFLSGLISTIVDYIDKESTVKNEPINGVRIVRLLKTLEALLALRTPLDKKFLESTLDGLLGTMDKMASEQVNGGKSIPNIRNLIQFTNECLILCPGINGKETQLFIANQLQWFLSEETDLASMSSDFVIGFLGALSCWIDTVGTQSQLSEKIQSLCENIITFLDRFQSLVLESNQSHVLRVLQSLLRTRNLTLLQNVYQWVIGKLKKDVQVSNYADKQQSNCDDTKGNVEIQLFYLASLTDIATNKSGSILSLWALHPPLIDLLMSITENSTSHTTFSHCALEMLKSHCTAHSHFASSITSSKIFEAESPALRFLKSLMNFWITMMRKRDSRWTTWLFDWISNFFRSATPYAPVLLERHTEFYKDIINEFANVVPLREKFGDLLDWMIQEQNYSQSSSLQEVVREVSLKILLTTGQPEIVVCKFSKVLKRLPNLIILPYDMPNFNVLDSECEFEWNDSQGSGNCPPQLTTPEVNTFLQNLLVYGRCDQPSDECQVPSKAVIKTAVDYLIRSKLKTTLGRAQEFFSQLQHMVRKIIRRGISSSFQWKLDFVYELQREILLCIYQSAFLISDIPETIRNFYVTNKNPCTGWLKRIGPDLINVSLGMRSYAMAYFFAVSTGDDQKAKLALLELNDSEGLKGMGELGAYLYLNSEYEKADHLAKIATSDPLSEIILERTKLIFESSVAKLESWQSQTSQDVIQPMKLIQPFPQPWNSNLLKLPVDSTKTLLSIQLETFGSISGVEIIGGVESFSNLKLHEMVQVEDLIFQSKKFTEDDKRRIQSVKINKMIECGNLQHTRTWITKSGWLDSKNLDLNIERKVDTFKLLGDLFYKEGNFFESGTLYSSVVELIEEDMSLYHGQPSSIPNEFKAKFYLSFAEKIKNSDTFYQRAVTKSVILTALEGRHQTQQLCHDRARESSRNCATQVRANAWFDYATFAYERSEEKNLTPILKEVLKSNSLHSYANFIKWNQKKTSHDDRRGKIMMAMIRLVKLYHQNYKFIPEDLITSNLWLNILPELAKISELRPYIIKKFPQAATFLVGSLEYGRESQIFSKRRGIFDSAAFSYTEATEEPFHHSSCDHKKLCQIENEGKSVATVLDEFWHGERKKQYKENVSDMSSSLANYFIMVREIERIGTTKEQLWAGLIQRMSSDWIRRVNTLRKDLARDRGGNPEKVKAYILPVVTFLKEQWRVTMEADTPADIAFICKYNDKITELIKELESCSTADKFSQICEALLHYGYIFESSTSSKLSLSNVSPVLSQYDFMQIGNEVSLPGLLPNVTIASACSTIMCLPTKTNPKRISFRGSDGKIYEYLVKGNENLHIDAGIMQLLKVIEEFTGYPTRHYCVTPIRERGGLIQIVPNALPLFVLYKKYLQRNNLTERPSEMYWRRLESLGSKDRSDVNALKEVYKLLKQDTPSDLIARDLLLCAESTMDWYRSVQIFTRDSAMGSAVGYIVGLADRHLDNILINLRQGHLVHVDFSILFGKGAHLKVPEKVPFRLTQNIVEALQYPGVNGAFAVYLDKFLQQFEEWKEMTMFCCNNIATDVQLEEGVHISPEIILKSELKSALELTRLRAKNIWKIMEIVLGELQENSLQAKTTSVWVVNSPKSAQEKLNRKIYRWRRLLANLDPLIHFIIAHSSPVGSLSGFHDIVNQKWNPVVMHFWSHTSTDLVIESASDFQDKFKVTEDTLQKLLSEIPPSDVVIDIREGPIMQSGDQIVDKGKLEAIINDVSTRISGFIPNETAKGLIEEATDGENLGQMFEGWISWV